jgi:hypothetical protein
MSYEAHRGEESGGVWLRYTKTGCDGERRESDDWIELETTPSFRRPTLVVKVPPVPPHGKAISELYLRSVAGE